MKGSKFQHRQELADMLEQFLMQSEVVFSDEELSKEWFNTMVERASAIQSKLAVFNYVSHEQDTHRAVFDVPKSAPLTVERSSLEVDTPQEMEVSKVEPVAEKLAEERGLETPSADKETELTLEKLVDVEKDEEVESVLPTEQEQTKSDADEVKVEPEDTPNEPLLVEKVLIAENEDLMPADVPEGTYVSGDKKELSTEDDADLEVNDMHGNANTLADRLRVKPIGKLGDSISLNERFLFSNELFNGNMEVFKRALNELDHIASLDDAKRYIEVQLQVENEWDNNSFAVKSFINLVERKFK